MTNEKTHTPTDDEREAVRVAHLDARRAAMQQDRVDWFPEYDREPTVAHDAFVRGWDAAVDGRFRRPEEPQGEPSDAPTVQFMARKGGKSQALIDQILAQADDRGIRVEVVYPQDEPSFEVPEPSAELRKPYTPTSESTDDPGGRLFRSRTYKALAERDFTGHMDEGRRTAFYEGWSAREQWQSHPEPQGEPSGALSVGVSVTLAGLRDRVAFNSKTHGDDAWWRGHVQGMKDAVDEVEGAALRASWEVR